MVTGKANPVLNHATDLSSLKRVIKSHFVDLIQPNYEQCSFKIIPLLGHNCNITLAKLLSRNCATGELSFNSLFFEGEKAMDILQKLFDRFHCVMT